MDHLITIFSSVQSLYCMKLKRKSPSSSSSPSLVRGFVRDSSCRLETWAGGGMGANGYRGLGQKISGKFDGGRLSQNASLNML